MGNLDPKTLTTSELLHYIDLETQDPWAVELAHRMRKTTNRLDEFQEEKTEKTWTGRPK